MENISEINQSILMAFAADDDDNREYLRRPFQLNDVICSTNGHAVVFVNGTGSERLESKQGIEDLLNQKREGMPKTFREWPDFEVPDRAFRDCEECDGDGSVHFSNDHNEYDVICATCDGVGRFERILTVSLPGSRVLFDARYVRMVSRIPNVKFCVANDELNFTFEGGCGLVCSTIK